MNQGSFRQAGGYVGMGCYTVVRLRVGIDSISQQSSTRREPFRHPLWLAAAVVFAFLQARSAALAIEAPVLAPRLVGFPRAYVGAYLQGGFRTGTSFSRIRDEERS
jgi:hypothetical protein